MIHDGERRRHVFFTRTYTRVLRPGLVHVFPRAPAPTSDLRRTFDALEAAMDRWCAAAYDLRKLCGKNLVEHVDRTRRYRAYAPGIRTLAALLILCEKVIKPVIAGAGKPRPGRPPKTIHPLDQHYDNLQRELR